MPRSNSKLPADWRAYASIGETCPADDAMRPARLEYASAILEVYRALLEASESDEDEAAEYADYHSLTRD